MNNEYAVWNELNGIFLSDSDTDAAEAAYNSGDMMELGRIIMAHVNRELAKREERISRGIGQFDGMSMAKLVAVSAAYALTDKGAAEVRNARLEGGVL